MIIYLVENGADVNVSGQVVGEKCGVNFLNVLEAFVDGELI